MITQIFLVEGVMELSGVDKRIEEWRTFAIRLIRDAANPLDQPMRKAIDDIEGLFLQDNQPDTPFIAKAIEAGAKSKAAPTDAAGTSSAPPLV